MYPKAEVDTEKIPALIQKYKGAFKFVAAPTPYFAYMDRRHEAKDLGDMMAKAKILLEEELMPLIK